MIKFKKFIIGHCSECDNETFYLENGNINYIDTTCKKCSGHIFIDTNDYITVPILTREKHSV